MTLDVLLDENRALEVSEKHAKDIESSESANSVTSAARNPSGETILL